MQINLNDDQANVLVRLLDIALRTSGLNELQNVQFFIGKIQQAKLVDEQKKTEEIERSQKEVDKLEKETKEKLKANPPKNK